MCILASKSLLLFMLSLKHAKWTCLGNRSLSPSESRKTLSLLFENVFNSCFTAGKAAGCALQDVPCVLSQV